MLKNFKVEKMDDHLGCYHEWGSPVLSETPFRVCRGRGWRCWCCVYMAERSMEYWVLGISVKCIAPPLQIDRGVDLSVASVLSLPYMYVLSPPIEVSAPLAPKLRNTFRSSSS